jgi:hypothetical protein
LRLRPQLLYPALVSGSMRLCALPLSTAGWLRTRMATLSSKTCSSPGCSSKSGVGSAGSMATNRSSSCGIMRSHGSTRSKGSLPSGCNSRAWRRTEGNWDVRCMKTFFRNSGLSLVLLLLFLAFWAAQSVAGFHVFNEDQSPHGGPILWGVSRQRSLLAGHRRENWESEFLQMGAYVILTTFLFQKGSAESYDPDEASELARERSKKPGTWLYRNSLSLAFLALSSLPSRSMPLAASRN